MMAALSFHVGEVQRNPYHLLVPAWMQDNVRRGGELVGGQGGAAPDFTFATLYRLREWRTARCTSCTMAGGPCPPQSTSATSWRSPRVRTDPTVYRRTLESAARLPGCRRPVACTAVIQRKPHEDRLKALLSS